jgi:hypothetical protein
MCRYAPSSDYRSPFRHLINNGVSESPPSQHSSNGNSGTVSGPKPRDLFIDLEGTNTAFQHWHPVSVAEKGGKLCGQADLGGAWEWVCFPVIRLRKRQVA